MWRGGHKEVRAEREQKVVISGYITPPPRQVCRLLLPVQTLLKIRRRSLSSQGSSTALGSQQQTMGTAGGRPSFVATATLSGHGAAGPSQPDRARRRAGEIPDKTLAGRNEPEQEASSWRAASSSHPRLSLFRART